MSDEVKSEQAVPVAPVIAPVAITVDGGVLLDMANWFGPLLSRPVSPILGCVAFDVTDGVVYASAFDYTAHMRVEVDMAPDNLPDGLRVVVPFGRFAPAIKAMVGTRKKVPLTFWIGTDTFTVNGANLALAGAVPEYPGLPAIRIPEHVGVFKSDGFIKAMDRAKTATSKDSTLPKLNGAFMEVDIMGGTTLLATDRYRLVSVPLAPLSPPRLLQDTRGALVPMVHWPKLKMAFKASEHITVTLDGADGYGPDSIIMEGGRVFYRTLLIDGDYPRIRSLFPDHGLDNTWTVDRVALTAALTAAGHLAERNTPVRMTFTDDNHVELDAGTGEEVHMTVARLPFTGDMPGITSVAFNPSYALDAVKSLDTATVTFGHTTAPKPAIICGSVDDLHSDDAYRALVMPVRLPA